MADEVRALSWGQLRDLGFDTADYVMGPLPQDSWLAKLDLKVWGKTPSLVCYFTSEDGKKFKLTAFPARHQGGREGRYTARDGLVDLSQKEIQPGQHFRLVTGTNSKGNPLWLSAEVLG